MKSLVLYSLLILLLRFSAAAQEDWPMGKDSARIQPCNITQVTRRYFATQQQEWYYLSLLREPVSETGVRDMAWQQGKEPFFCHMENEVHKHLNLWLKLRTGNDDSYMNMIRRTPRQQKDDTSDR